MCGLAGGVGCPPGLIEQMLDRIAHRGPDGRGLKDTGGMIHGHVRLAMVDLSSASSQPFGYRESALTFNGEIWNHIALREELKQQDGVQFKTTGDTEVLAAILDRYGLDGLNHIDGMFAFAWSSGNMRVVARDAFGEVPIYIAKARSGFIWASERKAFPPRVKPISIPPGHYVDLKAGQVKPWYVAKPASTGLAERLIYNRLKAGVQTRFDADAPIACLISGGLDSSLILALASELNSNIAAFTCVFDDRSPDLIAARRLCADFGIKLIEARATVSETAAVSALNSVEINSKAQIEIATLCLPLAQAVRAEGFKACLSGEAADELFGGYGDFAIKASKAKESQVIKLRRDALAKMARGNFVRCNKVFMAHGVECRLPFMQRDLVECAIGLGKKQSPVGKGLLKSIASRHLPKWVINRKKDTFQGASGASKALSKLIASPTKFYNSELKRSFGYLPHD